MAQITDGQVKRLFRFLGRGESLMASAMKAGMDRKTARRYRDMKRLPSENDRPREWRTREDPFVEVWPEVQEHLERESGLQAKTLFDWLQEKYSGRFDQGQLRTLQRRVKTWRATDGPAKEVFFSQVHHPGRLCASDFTSMNSLPPRRRGVTIAGQRFDHMVYHFVLTYSNWESVTICFSESFASLSEGLQNALWELGGVPQRHRTDRLSSAVNNLSDTKEFTVRYRGLLEHYGLASEKTNARKAQENGDVESSHGHFKEAVDQALLLRGSRDFASREEYAQKRVQTMPRLRGRGKQRINYRHVIDTLVREPGAFADYRYREELFPTSRFRMAYDALCDSDMSLTSSDNRMPLHSSDNRMSLAPSDIRVSQADKEYLNILHLAARESEALVDEALRALLEEERPITFSAVETWVRRRQSAPPLTEVSVAVTDLSVFDVLLTDKEVDDEQEQSGRREEAADRLLEGTASAVDAAAVRGPGQACGEGDAVVRTVSSGAGADGVRSAASESHRPAAASEPDSAGERSHQLRPRASAGESGAPVPDTVGWNVCGSAGEYFGFWGGRVRARRMHWRRLVRS